MMKTKTNRESRTPGAALVHSEDSAKASSIDGAVEDLLDALRVRLARLVVERVAASIQHHDVRYVSLVKLLDQLLLFR
jgi:hypothetical protein